MSNVYQLMNTQFPNMFKSPPGENSVPHRGIAGAGAISPSGQKVVCTPEVSLYQYSSPKMAAAVAAAAASNDGALQRIMEEAGLVEANSGNNVPGNNAGANMNGGNNHNVGANIAGGNVGPNGGFQCGFCGKTFQQKNTFQNHLRSHREGDDPYQCDICGKTFAVPARLTRHYRTHTGEKPYQCEYCNKSFSVKENLSVHRRIHTKERPYKCEVCERAFEHSGKLHRHMRIHTGERPHRCQICQKTFIQSGQLVIHMRTHTGEKPYVCKVCGKGFTCSKQLKVHTRTHTGEKPYTCDICGKSFGYNHVLKLHQVAHYGEKVYKCTLCNGTFNSKKALETHIKTHSEDHTPPGPGSPNTVTEPGVLSPTSISQATPQSQNSDKENRECSDSELSSQNSPSSNNEGPKTPPSPSMLHSYPLPPSSSSNGNVPHMHPQIHLGASITRASGNGDTSASSSNNVSSNSSNSNNNNNSSNNSNSSPQEKTSSALPIPYPMLPPGVQIQQAPHSRTTFLYVTSKLPPHPMNTNSSSSSASSPPTSPPLRQPQQNTTSNGFTSFSANSNANHFKPRPVLGTEFLELESEGPNSRKKSMIMNKIREKVMQYTKHFGVGYDELEQPQQQQQQQQQQRGRFVESGSVRYTSPNGGVSLHPILVPENLSSTNTTRFPDDDRMYHQNRLKQIQQQQNRRERSSSPEDFQNLSGNSPSPSTYTPGGVLALALTKGSKAAAAVTNNQQHNIPARVSLIPVTSSSGMFNGYHSSLHLSHQNSSRLSPRSNSPLDFHLQQQQLQREREQNQFFYGRGPGSVSPARNSLHSPSPNSTPRSTPSLQEDYSDADTQISVGGSANKMGSGSISGDISGDENSSNASNSSSASVQAGTKRSHSPNSNCGGGGPRKRSSLILEKYAMENPASPQSATTPPPQNSESILSQRLRLSSVIQYAEKCS